MATPKMSTITAPLEKSLKNCTLTPKSNQDTNNSTTGSSNGAVTEEDPPKVDQVVDLTTPTLELSSQPLPYHWEQCLDLKTGEIYYINWRTGMRTSEDPRNMPNECLSDDESSDDDDDSGGSSSDSSLSSFREQWSTKDGSQVAGTSPVLVVAGCKGCFMYYMVPKEDEVCPKCCGQLMHFGGSGNGN